jgi:uncharacterized repeat protein (TIGR01451 family)
MTVEINKYQTPAASKHFHLWVGAIISAVMLLTIGAVAVTKYSSEKKPSEAATGPTHIETPDPWYNPEWWYRQHITIDPANIQINLENYPMLINSSSKTWVGKACIDGADFIFTDVNATLLPHELKNYSELEGQGSLVAWVKLNSTVEQNKSFYVYYGHHNADDTQNCVPQANWLKTDDINDNSTETFYTIGDEQANAYRLTVYQERIQSGNGIVTSDPSGVDCDETCSHIFPSGAITLTATPDANSLFTGWTGICSGTDSCVVNLDSEKYVTATYTPHTHRITVTKQGTGSGIITDDLTNISCGIDCIGDYKIGTVVILTATPDPDSLFDGWAGSDCNGTSTCQVTIREDTMVTATFLLPPGSTDLSIAIADTSNPTCVDHQLAYTMTGTNNGPSVAKDATISLQLPSSILYQSFTSDGTGIQCKKDPTNPGGTLTCTIPVLASGKSVTITVNTNINETTDTSAQVTATISGSGSDSTTDNNQAQSTIDIDRRCITTTQ